MLLEGGIACPVMPDEITRNVMENGFERRVKFCVRSTTDAVKEYDWLKNNI